MVTPEQIDQLEAFDGDGARVLSVYLNIDPSRQASRSYRIVFEDLVKEAREGEEASARRELEREVARVQAWIESHEPTGKGVALFSREPRDVCEAYSLAVRSD